MEVSAATLNKPLGLLCLLALAPSPLTQRSAPQDATLTDFDRRMQKELTGREARGAVVFHFRPRDFSRRQREHLFSINLAKFEETERLLGMKYQGRLHIFLYKDVADLQKVTGSKAVAFSTGTSSVHQAQDFESVHELVHIFALQFPKDDDATTDGFAVEGLATALAQSDEGVPIHSWVAVHQKVGRLPDLLEFRRKWLDGSPSGVHPYHIAGSFLGYLIERFDIATVKRWYVNSTEAHMAFGATFKRLERDWRAWLRKRRVDPEHEEHVLRKLGLLGKAMPAAFRRKKGQSLLGKNPLSAFDAEDASKWRVAQGLLVGEHDGPWTRLHSKKKYPAKVALRVRFRLVTGNAVQLRLNHDAGKANEAIFATWSTFLSLEAGGFVPAPNTKIVPGQWNDVVFVNDGGTGRLYLNGFLTLEAKDAFSTNKGRVGIGVERGKVEVRSFEVLRI